MSAVSAMSGVASIEHGLLERLRESYDDGLSGVWYGGTAMQLVAAGLVCEEWLPGRGDNNRTSQRVVVAADGTARLLKDTRQPKYAGDETYLMIVASGRRFRVLKYHSMDKRSRLNRELNERLEREARAYRDSLTMQPQAWDPDGFKKGLALQTGVLMSALMRELGGERGPFGRKLIPAHKLSDMDLNLIREKFSEAVKLIENSKVEPINHAAVKRPALTLVRG